jgi:hypothetical protein
MTINANSYSKISKSFQTIAVMAFIIFMIACTVCEAHLDLIELPNAGHEALKREAEEKQERREYERRKEKIENGTATDEEKQEQRDYEWNRCS